MPALSPPSAWMWQLNSCAWVTGTKCAVQERSGVKVIAKCIPFSGWHSCFFFLIRTTLGGLKYWNYKTRLALMLGYAIPQGLPHQIEQRVEKRRAPISAPSLCQLCCKRAFHAVGQAECVGSSCWDFLGTSLWIVLCVSGRATQPCSFCRPLSQRAERTGSRGKYQSILRKLSRVDVL